MILALREAIAETTHLQLSSIGEPIFSALASDNQAAAATAAHTQQLRHIPLPPQARDGLPDSTASALSGVTGVIATLTLTAQPQSLLILLAVNSSSSSQQSQSPAASLLATLANASPSLLIAFRTLAVSLNASSAQSFSSDVSLSGFSVIDVTPTSTPTISPSFFSPSPLPSAGPVQGSSTSGSTIVLVAVLTSAGGALLALLAIAYFYYYYYHSYFKIGDESIEKEKQLLGGTMQQQQQQEEGYRRFNQEENGDDLEWIDLASVHDICKAAAAATGSSIGHDDALLEWIEDVGVELQLQNKHVDPSSSSLVVPIDVDISPYSAPSSSSSCP